MLGYAGSVETQQSFANAMRIAVTDDATLEASTRKIIVRNREELFRNIHGKDLLKRLLWCAGWDDVWYVKLEYDPLCLMFPCTPKHT
jgi:hypothetical protein